MLEDNNNKHDKEFSFIQEQITSKKRSKVKRMIYSVAWTMMLALIFGVVAGVAFSVSEPAISKFLGKQQNKKTVEFPTTTPDEEQNNAQVTTAPTPTGVVIVDNDKNVNDINPSSEGEIDKNETEQGEPASQLESVVVEKVIKADITDLTSIYTELRAISNEVNHSIVTVTSISSGVDLFNNDYEATKVTTGIVVFNNGEDLLILVNMDKIQDANEIKVTFSETLQLHAKLQNYDSDLNLAVISVALEDIPSSKLDNIKPITLGESHSLIVGTPIIALGSPNGYAGSMEMGIISSKGASVYITDNIIELFNTDVNYNDNGEGVIVNLRGEVIGIITHTLKDELNPDVTTVIGISRIKKIIGNLVNNKDRVYFGIKGADMTRTALAKAGIANGICITEVEVDSPALEAGLQSGDMIIAVNDSQIISVNTFHNIVSTYEPKTSVKVSIRRSTKNTDKDMDIDVILTKKNN